MNKAGLEGKRRDAEFQYNSFKKSIYYALDKLPWDNEYINSLWSINIAEARETTLKLHGVNLKVRNF